MGDARKLACIFLASGRSTRFRDNKLLADFGGRPMAVVVHGNFPGERFQQVIVVTRYPQVAVSAALLGYSVVENDDTTGDMAVTIRKGLAAVDPEAVGCMFSVCDQPLLTARSIGALRAEFLAHPGSIAALGHRGKRGNPVFFPRALFGELAALPPGKSGGAVIAAHPELLRVVEAANRRELLDVDYRGDLDAIAKMEP